MLGIGIGCGIQQIHVEFYRGNFHVEMEKDADLSVLW